MPIGGHQARDLIDVDSDGPLLSGHGPSVGGVAVRGLVDASEQVHGDLLNSHLIVGLRFTKLVENLGHDCLVEMFLADTLDPTQPEQQGVPVAEVTVDLPLARTAGPIERLQPERDLVRRVDDRSPVEGVCGQRAPFRTKGGPRSGGGCYELAELLRWCHPAEGFARTFVEFERDGVELMVGDGGEVQAAR